MSYSGKQYLHHMEIQQAIAESGEPFPIRHKRDAEVTRRIVKPPDNVALHIDNLNYCSLTAEDKNRLNDEYLKSKGL